MTDRGIDTVDRILEMLNGRSGFDRWWGMVDSESKDEIAMEMLRIIDQEFGVNGDD